MLIALPGVGPYAAANIMQLLGRYHRLPLDTESVAHGRNVLGLKGVLEPRWRCQQHALFLAIFVFPRSCMARCARGVGGSRGGAGAR
jgi:hypothetical protein